MLNPSPDEKQDNPLRNKTETQESAEKQSPPSLQQDSRHRIVIDTSMAGFTVAAHCQGEVQEHDSFDDRGLRPKKNMMKPPIETRGPRPLHVLEHARHVADGSEFPKDDDTSTVFCKTTPQVSSVASVVTKKLLEKPPSTSPSSPGLTQASNNSYRRLPSSQHPNFSALFAGRNSKAAAAIRASPPSQEEQQEEDTMSIEKVLPEQQIKPATKKAKRKRTPQRKSGQSSGRWTNEEHRAFLDGLKEFGREWKKVATRIPTRTSAQIRSHAQKYFAKLQREQETMNLSSDHGLLLNASASGSAAERGGGPMAPPQPLTPSVQKNVERLMADPQAVQREVENTLRALRERYRQLQAQLERQQQLGHSPLGGPRKPVLLQPPIVAALEEEVSSVGSRKRSLQDTMESSTTTSNNNPQQQQQQQPQQENDDHSSVTTNISASVASLGNEELIALHVLGGGLPRNESSASLVVREAAAAALPPTVGSVSSVHNNNSPASSPSRATNNQEIPSPKDNK